MGLLTKLPRWATGATAGITEPMEGTKDTGWVASQKPPAQYLNWLLKTIYDACVVLDGLEGKALNWTVGQAFAAAVTMAQTLGLTGKLTANGGQDLKGNLALVDTIAQTILKTGAGGLKVGTGASGGDLELQAGGVTRLSLAGDHISAAGIFAGMETDGDILLSDSMTQQIIKTAGGGLALGTDASGGDVSLQAGGATILKLLAAGSMNAQGKILANLATPAAAGDAATKGYVDGRFPACSWTALPTPDASWTAGTGGSAPSYWKDAAGIVHLKGTITAGASSSNMPFANGALPVGCRPATGHSPYFALAGGTNMGSLNAGFFVNASGGIGHGGGTGTVASGVLVSLEGIHFPAEA